MSQRLFRVYFSTEPHVPAHSYRHIWANDLEHAKDQVNKELAPHRQALDDVGYSVTTFKPCDRQDHRNHLDP
jgi:hypothetical protein